MPFPNPSTQFKPGRSGNPGGRPSGRSILARLRDLLEQHELSGKPIKGDKQVADLLTEVILRKALEGDPRFIELAVKCFPPEPMDAPEPTDEPKRIVIPDADDRLEAGKD